MIAQRLHEMLTRSQVRWPWPAERKPLRVEHVRYVNEPARDAIRAKAIAMAVKMGRNDLVERLEG